jgi:hypothetical protein
MRSDDDTAQLWPARAWSWAYAGLCALFLALLIGFGENGRLTGDAWEQAAVWRELSVHPWHPQHPILDVTAPHAFESPLALLWALFARITGASVQRTMVVASVVQAALWFSALRAFVLRTSSRGAPTLLVALPLVLFCWGFGAWVWSGFFHFEALLAAASYPSTCAGALVLWGVLLAWDLRVDRVRLLALGLVSAVCFAVHPTSAVVLCVSVGAVFVARARGALWPIVVDGAVIALTLLAGFFLAAQWPYFSLLDLFLSPGSAAFDRASHVLYTYLLGRVWPLFLLVPIVLSRLRSDKRDVFVALTLSMLLVYVAGIGTHEGLGRTVSWVGVYLQLGAADVVTGWLLDAAGRARRTLVLACVFVTLAFFGFHKLTIACALPGAVLDSGQHVLGDRVVRDVVLADVITAAVVPSMGGRVVLWRHPLYWIDDLPERRQDLAHFFADNATASEQQQIAVRRHARWILLDRSNADAKRFLSFAHVEAEDEGFTLLRIDPALVP